MMLNEELFTKNDDLRASFEQVVTGLNTQPEVSCSPTQDKKQASIFLKLLDPDAGKFTFQTFYDKKSGNNASKYARILHGTLDEHWDVLCNLNNNGAGVFVTVNETDLKGRKKENIIRIRAVFIEDDSGNAPNTPLVPHIVVESSAGKYHIYFLTDTTNISEVIQVQQVLVDKYGSDPNAKDIARVLRLPGLFHNKHEPRLVRIKSASGAPRFDWSHLNKIFNTIGKGARINACSADINNDLILPKPPLEIAKIHSALECAPSSKMEYDEWLRIGMALFNCTGGHSETYELWRSWSEKDERRYDDDEMSSKWTSFNSNRQIKIGIGTLYELCRKHGWDGGYQQDTQSYEIALEERKRIFNDFNDKHGVVCVDGKTVIVTRITRKDGGVKNIMMATTSARDLYANKYIVEAGQEQGRKNCSTRHTVKKEKLFSLWLNSESRRTYYNGVVFEPKGGLFLKDTNLPNDNTYNLYTGMAVEPRYADVTKFNLIIKHIRNVWCCGDDDALKYTLQWMANMFQNPGRQAKTVLVLRSGEGVGKNIIVDMFLRIFGEAAVQVTSPDDITGQFNDFLFMSVFIHLNEAVWGGSHKAQGRLKGLITDDHLTVEKKFMPKFPVRNCSHIIISSNSDWVAPIGCDDRRYVNYDLDESVQHDKVYFRALAAQTTGEGQAALLQCLLDMSIKEFDPTVVPDLFNRKSATRLDNKIRSSDSVTQWLDGILLNGSFSTCLYQGSNKSASDWDISCIEIDKKHVYAEYCEWCKGHNQVAEGDRAFGKKMRKLIPGLTDKQKWIGGHTRIRVYVIPDLNACRTHYANSVMRQDINWP